MQSGYTHNGEILSDIMLLARRTPAGVGWSSQPRRVLKQGDDFRVTLSHGVGTLISVIEEEK